MATPEQVSVWVGLDVGKETHFADVLDNDGERLFARAIGNDQGDIEALLDRAGKHGVPGLVIARQSGPSRTARSARPMDPLTMAIQSVTSLGLRS